MQASDTSLWFGGGFDEAAPSTSYKLSNARLVWPLYHGDGCVGLSGVYAIVNAIRLAIARKRQLTGFEVDGLMRAALQFMAGRLTPDQAVLSGLRVGLWRQLVQATAEAAVRQTGLWVSAERLIVGERGREAALAVLEQAVVAWRVPMLLLQGGHYTVLSGFTQQSLMAFDSGGARWISKQACGVPGDGDDARHVMYPGSFMALTA